MPLEAHIVSRCCWIAAVDARADALAAQRFALDVELVQDVARRKGARLLQQRDQPPAKFIDRHCRVSPCSICAAAIAVRAIARNYSLLPLRAKAASNRHSVVMPLMSPRVARQVGAT